MGKDWFLAKFDARPMWTVIMKGRAAKFSLRGPEGSLDIVVSYFHTGAVITEHDLFDVPPAARLSCGNFPALRAHLRSRVASSLSPKNEVLTLLAGDCNYVTEKADRVSIGTANQSTRNDNGEEGRFNSCIARPFWYA